jgi:hypothetical protein
MTDRDTVAVEDDVDLSDDICDCCIEFAELKQKYLEFRRKILLFRQDHIALCETRQNLADLLRECDKKSNRSIHPESVRHFKSELKKLNYNVMRRRIVWKLMQQRNKRMFEELQRLEKEHSDLLVEFMKPGGLLDGLSFSAYRCDLPLFIEIPDRVHDFK